MYSILWPVCYTTPTLLALCIGQIVWHWSACTYWLIVMLEAPDVENTWLPPPRLDDRHADFATYGSTFNDQYAHSFFWAVSVTTGVGRDVEPYTPTEVA